MVLVAAHSSLVVMGTVGGNENTPPPPPPPLELPPLEVDDMDFFLESTLLFTDL